MPDPSSGKTGPGEGSSSGEAIIPVWLSRLGTWTDWCAATFNVFGILITLGMMLAINVDVAGRTLFNSPLDGIPELVTLCVVAIVFLQISQAYRLGRLTRSNVIPDLISARCEVCGVCLEVLFDLVAAGIVLTILIVSVPLFLKSYANDTFIGSVGVFTVSVWPIKGIILTGCATLTLQLLLSALRRMIWLRHHMSHGGAHDTD